MMRSSLNINIWKPASNGLKNYLDETDKFKLYSTIRQSIMTVIHSALQINNDCSLPSLTIF